MRVRAEAIGRIAQPLRDEADFVRNIVEQIGTAQVVLIGEASHGTHEFYALRAAVTKELIAKHGFAGVAVEGDWPDSQRVDRYVRCTGTDRSANQALGSFARFPRWMWRNREVEQFVEELRTLNLQRMAPARAGFYGLDLYSLDASMRAVVTYLSAVDPAAAKRAKERYACFDHAAGDPQAYGMQANLDVSKRCEDAVAAQLVDMQHASLVRHAATPEGYSFFQAVTNAKVVADAEAYYRSMFKGRNTSWNLRDTHMADVLDLLRQHVGPKLVVWAHNSHVGDARATWMGDDGQLTLGQLCRERYPGETALIGFTTHTGTVQAAYDWDEPGAIERVRPSLAGSWEEALHGVGVPMFAVTGRALAEVTDGTELLHRAIGVVYRPRTERQSHYYFSKLAEQYDVIVHIDETQTVEPLEHVRPMPTDEHDAPETFPSGV
jgi:erythromycin esterase-like protein